MVQRQTILQLKEQQRLLAHVASDDSNDARLRLLVEGWKGSPISLPNSTAFQDPVDNFIYNQLVLAQSL